LQSRRRHDPDRGSPFTMRVPPDGRRSIQQLRCPFRIGHSQGSNRTFVQQGRISGSRHHMRGPKGELFVFPPDNPVAGRSSAASDRLRGGHASTGVIHLRSCVWPRNRKRKAQLARTDGASITRTLEDHRACYLAATSSGADHVTDPVDSRFKPVQRLEERSFVAGAIWPSRIVENPDRPRVRSHRPQPLLALTGDGHIVAYGLAARGSPSALSFG